MAITIPDKIPEQLHINTTWNWTVSYSDYPAADYTITYYLLNSAGTKITVTSSAGEVTVLPAVNTAYTAGKYYWQAVATAGNNKYIIDSGQVELMANFLSSTADPRTHAQKMVDNLEAVLQCHDSQTVAGMVFFLSGRSSKGNG